MSEANYPGNLDDIVGLFEGLSDAERREMLIGYADGCANHAPAEGEAFAFEDVRKDEECTDTVGIFLNIGDGGNCRFKVSLGPKVQTLTKAMTAILCKGLDGCTPLEIIEAPPDFVPRIVGAELVRLRSQTVYYVLNRMKSAAEICRRDMEGAS